MEKYDLHKNHISKLHFELESMLPYYTKNREKASRPHRHSFFQFLLFKKSGTHYVDYEIIKHPQNSLFPINQNQIHCFCTGSNNEGYLFHFNDSFISKLSLDLLSRFSMSIFNEIGSPYLALTDQEMAFFETQIKTIKKELNAKKENFPFVIMHQFLALLYKVEQIKNERLPPKLNMNPDFSIVLKFKQLIAQNIDQKIGLKAHANALGINPKKLTSLTKKYVGSTPGTLIKEIKLLEAKRALSNYHLSIKEIAYSLGFDQPSYFTKFFKKETRVTPGQFRAQLR